MLTGLSYQIVAITSNTHAHHHTYIRTSRVSCEVKEFTVERSREREDEEEEWSGHTLDTMEAADTVLGGGAGWVWLSA